MKSKLRLAVVVIALSGLVADTVGAEVAGRANATWNRYLDYAYIYSSATMPDLRKRLDGYGVEAGLSLREYTVELRTRNESDPIIDNVRVRRQAIAELLAWLSTGDAALLEQSTDTIDGLVEDRDRYEDRYWYRYIHAHRALEGGNAEEFVRQVFGLWLEGVAPVEEAFESIHAVSLAGTANSGFASAVPYLYENVARLILIRSREEGVERGLDPLAAVVRMLDDDRVGAYPRIVPVEVSSKAFLDRIVQRLEGPASDGGRLSFTLALFEAVRRHETARSMLASEGFSKATLEAIKIASASYRSALEHAESPLGRSAVYVQALRQIGEIHAAKQRLGVDPPVNVPFRIVDAIGIYREMHAAREHKRWLDLGFRNTARTDYVETMHSLWAEIQEAGMNLADYHLGRALADPAVAARHLRSAERVYVRYLAMHREFADGGGAKLVPDSATFGVYEAAKGFGDIHLLYSTDSPSRSVAEAVTKHYQIGLRANPFDRELWEALAISLERRDLSADFLGYAQPIVDVTLGSRRLADWIAMGRPGSEAMAATRHALADDRALLMMAFAGRRGEATLGDELLALRAYRGELDMLLVDLEQQLAALDRATTGASPASLAAEADDGLPSVSVGPPAPVGTSRKQLLADIAVTGDAIRDLDTKIEGFSRALPLYEATASGGELIQALRAQRDHPAHAMLRRLRREMAASR